MQVNTIDILLKENLRLVIYSDQPSALLFDESDAREYGEARWQLQEGKEYNYELVDSYGNPVDWFLEGSEAIIKPNSRHRNQGRLCPGIYVGTLNLKAKSISLNQEIKLQVEVQSIKTNYRSEYRRMLNDITSYYTDLVMQQGSPVTQKFDVDYDASPQTLYQKFSFVRSIIDCDTFDDAMHKIISNPVRTWTETTVEKHMDAVHRLSRGEMRQVVSRPNRIIVGENAAGLFSLPRTITVIHKKDSIDTSENQFIKYVITSFYAFCSSLSNKKNASDQLKLEIEYVCEKLASYMNGPFFKEVSLPATINIGSPVLQRKEGYREVLQAWLMFDLAAKIAWEGGDTVYEAGKKNVAVLYEYWLFFQLLNVVGEIFNIDAVEKSRLVKCDKDKLNLEIRQGKMKMLSGKNNDGNRLINVNLYYNRTFGYRDDIQQSGSWTMTMRPDYTLSLWPGEISENEAEEQELIVHIHFDAKYRLNNIVIDDKEISADQIERELDEEDALESIQTYKRGDLLKMHAYKDAIRRTGGAYVLYPGTEKKMRKGFHEIIPGLGAFCIAPGREKDDQISALKEFIIQIKEHLLDRTSQREKMAFHKYDIYKNQPSSPTVEHMPESTGDNRNFLPDETYVILGYIKSDAHLDWIKKKGLYNFRTGTDRGSIKLNPKITSAKYLLLHRNGKSEMFIRLSEEGPRVFKRSDLLQNGYPQDNNEAAKTNDIYLVFKLNIENTEEVWGQYQWNMSDVIGHKKRNIAIPEPILLSELLKHKK